MYSLPAIAAFTCLSAAVLVAYPARDAGVVEWESPYEILSSGSWSGGGTGTPFGGAPPRLPGTIQAEHYDKGGTGVAYLDTTTGNAGGVYRSGNVDVEATSDAGGGYNVGWTAVGEWLKYTVDVTAAGTYTLEFRVAARAPGATFHLEVNGVDKTGPLTVPNTGSYQTWATVRRTGVSLPAGPQVWRLVIDAVGTVAGNFNYIRVVGESSGGGAGTPFGGTPAAVPGTIEAEDFDEGGEGVAYHDISSANRGGQYRDTAVDLESSFDTGGGYTLSYARAGEWINYTAAVSASGTYTFDVRVASNGQGGTFHIEANGVDRTGPIAIPNTGGWWTWTTIRKTGITLAAGPQALRLVMDANGATTFVGNINWFRFSSPAAGAATLEREPYLQSMTPHQATIVWTSREPGAGAVRYTGPSGATLTAPASTRPFSAAATGLPQDVDQHEAVLIGLAAGTRYTYDVLVGGVDATPGQDTFRTAPLEGGGRIRVLAFGDSGVGSVAQSQLAAVMAADTFDLALHTGDVAYGNADMQGGGSYVQYEEWFFRVYASWLRSAPFYPSIGNHDDERQRAQAWRDVFVLPEHGASSAYPDHAERFYSFDAGPVHFVALDTETAFSDPARRQAQLAWLEADLAATAQPWRIVYFHRSPYTAGSGHGSDLSVRAAFAPIFEGYGVQLVLSGHEHTYERSIPWREFVSGGTAVTYVVTGGGGAALYPVGSAPWTAVSASRHHYVRLEVEGCALTGEAVGVDGSVFDRFEIRRCD